MESGFGGVDGYRPFSRYWALQGFKNILGRNDGIDSLALVMKEISRDNVLVQADSLPF